MLGLRDIIAQLKIRYDKAAGARTDAEVASSFNKIKGHAKAVGAAIAAAFTTTVIFNFAKGAVQAAVEAERSWNRLAGTLASAGVEFKNVEGRIRAGARAMKEAAGIGDDDYADTLARLVSLTGDFNLSLSQMGLVADVAARFFGNDLTQAADLLGRTLAGNTRGLRALGIATDDVNEGLRILAERSSGAAANELNSLDGRMKQLKDSTGELREEMGFLILRLFGGENTNVAINRFRLGIDGIADAFSRIRGIKFNPRGGLYGMFGLDMAPKAEDSGTPNEIATLAGVTGVATIVTPEQHAARAKAAETARRAAEQERFRIAYLRAQRENAERNKAEQERVSADTIRGGGKQSRGLGLMEVPEPSTETLDAWDEMWGAIENGAVNASRGIAGTFQDTFELLLSGAATIGSTFETLARGIAGALIGGIAEYAAFESGKETAAGVGKLAAGTWPPNPAAIASALAHFKSAGLWAILAGAAGAGQSAIAGGGRGGMSGGIPSGASDIGGRIAQGTEPKNEIHFYFDQFNKDNPVAVRYAGAVMKAAAAEDSSINIHPYPRT